MSLSVLPPCFGSTNSCLRGGTWVEMPADRLRFDGVSHWRKHEEPRQARACRGSFLRHYRKWLDLLTKLPTDSPTVFFGTKSFRAGTTVISVYC